MFFPSRVAVGRAKRGTDMKGCRRAMTMALGLALGGGSIAHADSLADQMAQAKVEADLGHSATAITILTTIAADPSAPRPLQAEALVRLGAARATAGDGQGRVAAFERVMREHADDEAAIRLLILAAGGVVPGPERWEQAWRQVQLGVDVTDREHPLPGSGGPRRRGASVDRWPTRRRRWCGS